MVYSLKAKRARKGGSYLHEGLLFGRFLNQRSGNVDSVTMAAERRRIKHTDGSGTVLRSRTSQQAGKYGESF